MERNEIERWLKSVDRKIIGIDRPEEEDFFQAIKCLESVLNEKSYEDGKEEGHGEGYDEGYSDGRQDGRDEGLRDGKLKRAKEKCKPIETGEEEMYFDCSLCEGDSIQEGFKFCPDCGAEIDW